VAIEKHVIQLTAKDQVSPVFAKVGKSAEDAGKKAEQAGQKGARSAKDWAAAASAVGAAVGALGLVASRAAAESEASNARIATSFENAGYAIDDYQAKIDELAAGGISLGFDDEDTQDQLAKLVDATGDADKAFRDLAVAQDIARARNIDLAAATNIVIAAEQGRVGSLARLGIQLDANASSEESIAALQTKYAGQAEAYADTSAAAYDRLGIAVSNALEDVGGFVNQNAGVVMALSATATAAGPAIAGFNALRTAAMASSLALGPVGLGLAAVAAVAAIAITVLRDDTDDVGITMDQATEAARSFNEEIGRLGNAGVSRETTQLAASLSPIYQKLGEDIVTASDAAIQLEKDMYLIAPSQREATAAAEAQMAALQGQILTEEQFQEVQKDTISLLEYQGNNMSMVRDRVAELYAQFEAGTISADDLAWSINWLNDNSASYGKTLEQLANQSSTAANTTIDIAEATGTAIPVIEVMNNNINRTVAAWGKAEGATVDATKSVEQMAAESAALDKQLESLGQSLRTDFAGAASASYQRVVGFTSGMVDAISTSKDWADALIGPVGTFSELDNMLANGTIDLEDYNEAQQAQVDITDALARSTTAANEIQVKQADTVADGAEATADYLEALAALPEAQQALALAWADTDVAGQAMEVANLASQFGNMDDTQQAAFEGMVESAAATNPALAAVLEDLGLIKVDLDDPTGWQLVIDDSATQTSLADVVTAIDNLTNAILGVPDVVVDATLDTGGFWDAWNGLPSYKRINVYTDGGYGPTPEFALGGVVGWGGDAAALGRVGSGNMALVGEAGPEIVHLPGGSRVEPNSSSRWNMGKGGGDIVINGPITIMANNPTQFVRELRQSSVVLERR
jgi:hypothetical protein